jgi:flagellar assembly protein FliH
MTSLFELPDVSVLGELPVELISAGVRGVSMLEFFVVEEERQRAEQERAARESVYVPESAATVRARQTQAMVDAARAEAAEEARRGFELELTERLEAERERVEQVVSEFAMDRQRYFAAAEAQVVKLAIAIARKVLQREVDTDQMHLTATVRAALARVHDGSATVLRVRPEEREQWEALFANERTGSLSVVADEQMERGDCVLETDVGKVELGAAVQVAEVERGFGDLLRRQGE